MEKIIIEWDENISSSYWAAVVKMRALIREINEAHIQRTYFGPSTPITWWIRLLDHLGVPKDAGVKRCGEAIRDQGLQISTAAVQQVVDRRRES